MFPNKENAINFFFSDFVPFWPFFNPKTAKKNKKCQNPNRLMKFSEIWYVDASQQKNATKILFLDFGFFGRFLNKKQQKKKKKIAKIQTV